MPASYSHSHAYQVRPAMVTENGSVLVMECDCSISSPLRMCHPMLASPSRRGARTPAVIVTSRMMKIRSLADGARKRNQAGGLCSGGGVRLPSEWTSICEAFEFKLRSHSTRDILPDGGAGRWSDRHRVCPR